MSLTRENGTTLLEIIIALIVLGLVVFGIYSIQGFSDHQLIASARRAKLQNEAIYTLEHMAKHISAVIADPSVGDALVFAIDDNATILRGFEDSPPYGNGNGVLDPSEDDWIWYKHLNSSSFERHQLQFCQDVEYPVGTCAGSFCPCVSEILTHKMVSDLSPDFVTYNPSLNYLEVRVILCWDPDSPSTCGSPGNPRVEMTSRIPLPAVSAN